MPLIDPDKVSALLAECAQEFIIPRYKMLEDHEIRTKNGPRDLVTQADLDVEAKLTRVLPDWYPGSLFVGEEGVSSGAQTLEPLRQTERIVWVADPLDGTHNFVHQGREFGVMLACVIGGRVEYGWIFDVLGNVMTVAEKGSGAYSGAQRLCVVPKSTPSDMTGFINPRFFPKQYRDYLEEQQESFGRCHSLHCSAHEHLRIASGQAQFAVYSKIRPWDHLPGSLIVAEAGGQVLQWDRSPYKVEDDAVGLIVSAGDQEWRTAYDVFLDKIVKENIL